MSHREKVPEPGFKSRFYFTPKVRVLSPQCTKYSALVAEEDRKDLEEKLKASAS